MPAGSNNGVNACVNNRANYFIKCFLCDKRVDARHDCVKKEWSRVYGRLEAVFDYGERKRGFLREFERAKRKNDCGEKISTSDFSSVMPVEHAFDLREGGTPLARLRGYGREHACELFVKNEAFNPTGCFKDRETGISVNACLREGKKTVATASSGNAAASLSFYARRAGLRSLLFVPESTPRGKIALMEANGARIIRVKGSIEDAYRACASAREDLEREGARVCTSGIDFFKREGCKVVAFEIFLQLGRVPDWVITPCGDGSNLSGIFKGFQELKEMGLTCKIPRMVGVQIRGGSPLEIGLEKGMFHEPVEIKSPPDSFGDSAQASFNYFFCLRAIEKSGGRIVTVRDEEIACCLAKFARDEKRLLRACIPEPTTAEVLPAFDKLAASGAVKEAECAVLFFSGDGRKTQEELCALLAKFGYFHEAGLLKPYLNGH